MAKDQVEIPGEGEVEQATIDALAGDWQRWMYRGSSLFQCARRAAEGVKDERESRTLYFGLALSNFSANDVVHQWEYERSAGLLFAMAVECWLKALIVFETKEPLDRSLQTGHCLLTLASRAKVDEYLDDIDRRFLRLLSTLIMGVGRFAAPKKPEDLIWCDPAANHENWQAIQEAIYKRFNAM
jgi:hypothetical protein